MKNNVSFLCWRNFLKRIFLGKTTFVFIFIIYSSSTINCTAQLSNQQGITTIGIRPSGTIFTFGLPQPSSIPSGFQQSVFNYSPFPFTVFPVNTTTTNQGKTQFFGLIGSFDLGLNISKLLVNDRIIKAEVGVYYACVPHSYSIKNDYQFYLGNKEAVVWQNTLSYSGLSASITYTSKSRGRSLWGEARNYAQFGLKTMNYLEKSADNQEDWVFNGRGFKIQSEVVNRKSVLAFIEIGKTYWRRADDMRSLDMGIRVGIPMGYFVSNTITGYTNSQATGASNFHENGAYIGFQMSYNLPLKRLQKSHSSMPKTDKIYCEMERKVIIKHTYKVKTEEISLELFDHENEDGDIVSVCFNGQYILEKYTLLNKPKQLKIKLLPYQRNVLTVFANNTGKEGANTSAIRFIVDGKMQELILYADKKESEGVEFIY
ncbi:MAG: hypothetical protein H7339_06150 [Arcicella sp.]|nr:hypothetical protein [Arcicella sp.]